MFAAVVTGSSHVSRKIRNALPVLGEEATIAPPSEKPARRHPGSMPSPQRSRRGARVFANVAGVGRSRMGEAPLSRRGTAKGVLDGPGHPFPPHSSARHSNMETWNVMTKCRKTDMTPEFGKLRVG